MNDQGFEPEFEKVKYHSGNYSKNINYLISPNYGLRLFKNKLQFMKVELIT